MMSLRVAERRAADRARTTTREPAIVAVVAFVVSFGVVVVLLTISSISFWLSYNVEALTITLRSCISTSDNVETYGVGRSI
jgi:hypothetical protein